MILAINTSTPQFSVAVLRESGSLVAENLIAAESKTFRAFMPALSSLLQYSGVEFKDMEAVAVAIGPGSFTGLRVGLATAKGICQGLGIPVIGISSLEAMASQWPQRTFPICSIIDSRKGEVSAALFRRDNEGLVRLTADTCLKYGDLSEMIKGVTLFLGNDFDRQESMIRKIVGPKAKAAPPEFWGVRASAVGVLGVKRMKEHKFDSLLNLIPSYLRPPDIRPNPFSPAPDRILSQGEVWGDKGLTNGVKEI
jgi:tRNA threonylcarbamoyladenosine biosynthesis protein TsaB